MVLPFHQVEMELSSIGATGGVGNAFHDLNQLMNRGTHGVCCIPPSAGDARESTAQGSRCGKKGVWWREQK